MYLARKRINNTLHYFIRQTVPENSHSFRSQEIAYLGTNPSEYIVYPGGHAFYFDKIIEEQIEHAGAKASQEDLEDVFWPFLKPEVKRLVASFRSRGKRRKRKKITPEQEEALRAETHIFDKRRIHYLKFGRMNQGYVGRMSGKLLRNLQGKSRDEIEQRFWQMEKEVLHIHELKTYVYVIFDLQNFFTSAFARQYPESIDDFLMDDHFIRQICQLNNSEEFWGCKTCGQSLNDYLVRYLIMYFDHDFTQKNPANDFFKEFVNWHKRFTGYPRKIMVGMEEVSKIFEVSQETLNTIGKTELIRTYRRLAQKHHPDTGGEHDKFIRLNEAFHSLMRKRRFEA